MSQKLKYINCPLGFYEGEDERGKILFSRDLRYAQPFTSNAEIKQAAGKLQKYLREIHRASWYVVVETSQTYEA